VIKTNEDDTTSSSRIFVKIMMQEVMESMGLPTLKERFLGPRDQGIVYWHVPVGRPKKHAYQLLYKCYGRDARASHGELSIQRFVHYRADVLFPRTRPASLWNNGRRCQRPSRRLRTVRRTRTHPLRILRPIPIANTNASDDSRDRRSYRRSPTPPRQYRRDSPSSRSR